MPPDPLVTGRRFVLGRQGLWPGRRWSGRKAVDPVLRYLTEVQVDPLNVIGHSQDLVLGGRIAGYRAQDLEDALYRRRSAFEWGGNLQIHPVEEHPYLRRIMERVTAEDRWRRFAGAHASRIREVERALRRRGPLGGRDFGGSSASRAGSFRGGKEATQALYYLWLRGDVMIESRRAGEKVYDLTSRLLPRVPREVPVPQVEERLILQTLRDLGLATSQEWLAHAHARIRRSTLRREWKRTVRDLVDRGLVQSVEVAGWSGPHWLLAEALPELEALREGRVPRAWRPVSTTTTEEAVFLSPLEFTTTRGRSQQLFDFELLCEFYKPASKRRWGYYTMPVLYGDALVARVDLKLDVPSRALRLLGFWPEDPRLARDRTFAEAFGNGLARLADFHAATQVDLSAGRFPETERTILRAFRGALTGDRGVTGRSASA